MLYGLLVTLFVLLCFMLITIILLQKSKSSMGLGGFGGGTQMLFGGSGGQDLFQKVTWVMVALFMLSSLTLTLMKSSSRYHMGKSYHSVPSHAGSHEAPSAPVQNVPAPQTPSAFVQPEPESAPDTQTA